MSHTHARPHACTHTHTHTHTRASQKDPLYNWLHSTFSSSATSHYNVLINKQQHTDLCINYVIMAHQMSVKSEFLKHVLMYDLDDGKIIKQLQTLTKL